MLSSEMITIGLAAVAAVVWLVRLEGRVNSATTAAAALELKLAKVEAAAAADIASVRAKAESDAAKHDGTKIEVVRLQEQIKHLTDLIEKWFEPIDPPSAKRRRTVAQG